MSTTPRTRWTLKSYMDTSVNGARNDFTGLPPTTYSTTTYAPPQATEFEEISDVRGDPGQLKPVSHLHVKLIQPAQFVDFSVDIYGRARYYTHGPYSLGLNQPTSLLEWRKFPASVPMSAVGDACKEAFDQWQILIPTRISIANFFYELKDLPGLIVRLEGAKTLPNGFLAYEFGWKPLISDLKTLARLIPTVIANLEEIRARNHRYVKMHFRKELPISDVFHSVGPSLKFPYIGSFKSRPINPRAVFRCHAYVKLDVEGLEGDIGVLKAFVIALGLNNPAKIVWNAIPYSFILDWFIRISDRFPPYKVYESKMTARGFCWSLKETGVREYYTDGIYPLTGGSTKVEKSLGRAILSRYTRQLTPPVGNGAFQISSLSGEQQALLAALISQRFLK